MVEVFVICHASLTLHSKTSSKKAAYLRVVFKSRESHNSATVAVDHGQGQVGRFNKFENFRIRVDTVVNVVLADFD